MVDPSPIINNWGTATFIAWIVYQVYAPKFGLQTRFTEVVGEITSRLDKMGERLNDVEDRQDEIVAVTQVIAVSEDGVDGDAVEDIFDESKVDKEPLFHEDGNRVERKWYDDDTEARP